MLRYFLKRLALTIAVLLAVILLVFTLLDLLSGARFAFSYSTEDGVDRLLTERVSSPFLAAYLRYCYHVFFHLDFGRAYYAEVGLSAELWYRWGYTLRIAGLGLLFTAVLGLPLGVLAAIHQDRPADRVISGLSLTLGSVPSYCLALLLALLFAVRLNLLPAFGASRPGALVLPVVTVAAGGLAQVVRMVRATLLETLGEQYVIALRARGLREGAVVCLHALRNSFIPIAASFGEEAGKLLCGTLVVEKFFAIPGVGYYLLSNIAYAQRDYNIILGCTVTIAALLVAVSLLTDMLYFWTDPQMRVRYAAGRRHAG